MRAERDFTGAERTLLELMRPQLASMHRRLHELALLRATEAAVDAGRCALLLHQDGMIAWISPAAAETLGLVVGELLPETLDPACRAAPGSGHAGEWSAPIRHEGLALQTRRVEGVYPGLDAIHIRPLDVVPSLSALQALGLRRRQAEVLQVALAGRSSPQIARAMGLSPRTVEKHMESIYASLGAANRTEAVLIATRALEA